MSEYRKRKKNPYMKAIVMCIALFFGIYFYSVISTPQFVERVQAYFSGRSSGKLSVFLDEQRDSIQCSWAGFWVSSQNLAGGVRTEDRLELQKNGIVWQVTDYFYKLPSGAQKQFTHIIHAFCYPYSYDLVEKNLVIAERKIIRQIYIFNGDTCYGDSFTGFQESTSGLTDINAGNVLKVNLESDMLILNDVSYSRFEDEDLSLFFPDYASITLIDKISDVSNDTGKATYRVEKGAITLSKPIENNALRKENMMHLCKGNEVIVDFQRQILRNDLQAMNSQESMYPMECQSYITNFYIPLCFLARKQSWAGINAEEKFRIKMILNVEADGSVSDASVSLAFDGKIKNNTFSKIHGCQKMAAVNECKSWHFTRNSEKEAVEIKMSLVL